MEKYKLTRPQKDAMLRQQAVYDRLFAKLDKWHQPEVTKTFRVGSYTERYEEDRQFVYVTTDLKAEVMTCGAPGEIRLVLVNSEGMVEYTARFHQTPEGRYILTSNRAQIIARELPTIVENLNIFATRFLTWINKPQPVEQYAMFSDVLAEAV